MLYAGVKKALPNHKKAGIEIVVLKNGKIKKDLYKKTLARTARVPTDRTAVLDKHKFVANKSISKLSFIISKIHLY